jgi:hypothetical protein
LSVFCDAPKRPEHAASVDAVRRYVDGIDGFASVSVTHRDTNLGLARSIIKGVGSVLVDEERVIVLEDDLVLSPHFLRYMNDGLACYADDDRVASIHGYCYPTGEPLPETFFLRGADCWGWATWRRAWAHFRADGTALLSELRSRGLTRTFDMDGRYPYVKMLQDQIAGRNDSWAVRWHASIFLRGGLTLYPGTSLVHNIGNDASGTHGAADDTYSQQLAEHPVRVEAQERVESAAGRATFVRFFGRAAGPAPLRWIKALRNRLGTFR